MTALDLTQLAADCEARAKAGEKPVMTWRLEASTLDGTCYIGYLDRVDMRTALIWERDGNSFVENSLMGPTHLGSFHAAQLFAEALLAEATAPLHAARVKALEDRLAKAATRIRNMRKGLRENAKAFTLRNFEDRERRRRTIDLAISNKSQREAIRVLIARIAALEAALAEAKDVACKWRDHHAEKPDRATYWNDLAVRWQDALAGQAEATPALRLMEDAPRDGSIYLVWCSINRQWIPTRWSFEMEWPMSWSGACPRGDVHLAGWLPLPAPLAIQDGGDK